MLTLRIITGRMCGTLRTLDRTALIIGRGNGCDWILPDADCFLSSQHCRASWADGQYLLTDTSTNGVFHNHSPEPIGRGRSVVLTDGDRLALGDYELEVSIGHQPETAAQELWGESEFGDTCGSTFRLHGFGAGIATESPGGAYGAAFGSGCDGGLGVEFGQPAGRILAAEPDDAPALNISAAPLIAVPTAPAVVETVSAGGASDFLALLSDANFLTDGAEPDLAPAPDPGTTDAPTIAATQDTPIVQDAPILTVSHAEAQQPKAPDATGSANLLTVFLEAAGLPASAETTHDPQAAMRMAGATYRQMIEGLCGLLAMRSQVKSEFRIERTVIGSRDNNPLKFSVNAAQTAQQLLQAPLPGFLPAEEAVRQSFRDVQQHELAASVGMQSALSALLRRFDPVTLKERLDRQSLLASFVPAARRARYWELYEALYQEIAAEAENDFQSLFGREFAQAYERQIRAMSDPDGAAPAGSAPHAQGESR